jgi:hypothetical protein
MSLATLVLCIFFVVVRVGAKPSLYRRWFGRFQGHIPRIHPRTILLSIDGTTTLQVGLGGRGRGTLTPRVPPLATAFCLWASGSAWASTTVWAHPVA